MFVSGCGLLCSLWAEIIALTSLLSPLQDMARVSVDLTIREIQLTLYVELDGGVGHPHHILCNAGQLEVVVISADVEKSQVDRVDVWPVHIGL